MGSVEDSSARTPAPALDHVQVAAPAGCEEAARGFYGRLLGLRELSRPAALRGRGGAWFALADGQQLHIGVQEPFAPARKAHPALRVSDESALQGLAQSLAGAGAEVAWDQEIPGVARFFTADPWGNRLELLADQAAFSSGASRSPEPR